MLGSKKWSGSFQLKLKKFLEIKDKQQMDEQTEMHTVQNDAANGGATLVWRNVNVFVTNKRRRGNDRLKQIISNSTGSIEPGTLMAVMGAR